MRATTALAMLLLSASPMYSCTDTEPAPANQESTSETTLPDSYLLPTAPAGAHDVQTVRGMSKDGDTTAVVGRIAKINDSRALFTLVDRSLQPCNERPEDNCKTPWDYCCEEARVLRDSTIVIEFHDAGKLRKVSARGWHGIDHLVEVTVKGKVQKDTEGNVVLVATGIHLEG